MDFKLGELFKQAKEMQGQFAKMQEKMANKTVEATAGGGMVKVVANGKNRIVSLTLDDEVMKLNDKKMIEDLVSAGVNEALQKAQEMVSEEMKGLAGNLGPLGNLFNQG